MNDSILVHDRIIFSYQFLILSLNEVSAITWGNKYLLFVCWMGWLCFCLVVENCEQNQTRKKEETKKVVSLFKIEIDSREKKVKGRVWKYNRIFEKERRTIYL